VGFRFLHTSDWHIGKPFGRFPRKQADLLAEARLTAIDRLADCARAGGVRHILVAGDAFDRPTLSDKDLREPISQLQAHGDLQWHFITGNHDPAGTGGVWERALRDGLPGNVALYLDASPIEGAPGVGLLPAPLASRATTQDPTAWMEQAATPEGAIRIGLAHGSVRGFGTEQRASVEIAPDRPRSAGLDYLALGDWHGLKEIGPRAFYIGTPEPDGFLDNAPGQALIVDIESARATPRIERRSVAHHRWVARPLSTLRASDLASLEGEMEGLGPLSRRVVLQITVSGRISLTDARELAQRLDRLEPRLFHLERRLDAMTTVAATDDLSILAEGPIRDLAIELSQEGTSEDPRTRAIAQRALMHLLEIAGGKAQADREAA
jgi:DNA repair exonuclease SbcCD nuclease subunit